MLWYKTWLETRWIFLAGLLVLACSAASVVFSRPTVVGLMPLAAQVDTGGELGRRIRESAEIVAQYRGYVWSQWFNQELMHLGIFFAALLGAGTPLAQSGLFLLSMPVSRRRILGVRAVEGLGELAVIVFASSLLIPLLSPMIGERYGLGDSLIHSAWLFAGCATVFSLATWLSAVFSDHWRWLPVALVVGVAVGLGDLVQDGVFGVMSGARYFRTGELPWLGLLMFVAASGAMLYGAKVTFARRDF